MSVLYFIPARGGSKGLPGKNILDLCGKPMIAYSIEAAKGCSYPGSVVVSTDDAEIGKVAKRYGARVVDRPKELAGDTSPVIDALMHCLKMLDSEGEAFDTIVLLQPTSPLRTSGDIDGTMKRLLETGSSACISVSEPAHPPEWGLRIVDGTVQPLFGWDDFGKRRQDLPKAFFPNGAVYAIKAPVLREKRRFYIQGATSAFIMPADRSVDVDTRLDFILAQAILGDAKK